MNKIKKALAYMHARPIMYDFTQINEENGDKHYDILNNFFDNQLEIDEINRLILALSTFQDDIEINGGITPSMRMFHQKIERKLKKQEEMLKDEN